MVGLALILLGVAAAGVSAIAFVGRAHGRRHLALEKLGRFIVVAVAEAARRGHPVVLPEHLLVTALTDPDVADRPSISELRAQAFALLDKMEARERVPATTVRLSRSARSVSLGAVRRASARGATVVSASDLLAELRDGDGAVSALAAVFRDDRGPAASTFAHAAYRGATEGRARVIVWNDPKTTIEQVVEVLEHHFAISSAEAMHIALAVHHNGSRPVGSYPPGEAAERVAKASAYLRAKGIPLHLSIEAPTSPRAPQ